MSCSGPDRASVKSKPVYYTRFFFFFFFFSTAILLRLGQDNPLNPGVLEFVVGQNRGEGPGSAYRKVKWVRFFGIRGESNPRRFLIPTEIAQALTTELFLPPQTNKIVLSVRVTDVWPDWGGI